MKLRRWKQLTASVLSILCTAGLCTLPESAMETGTGELLQLQQFLLGNAGNGQDCNGDGIVNGFDLTLMRQQTAQQTESIQDGYTGFIRASGKLLVDETGKQYRIKGMAFGNEVWSNSSAPPWNRHHTADSYQELAEMGFNSTRFYLNYGLFESDDAPYTYKEDGFAWLDQNIAWAKAAGIRLVLNMHYPQGGYQSQGDGTALWTEPENQKRLCALWTEIARRYADEPAILGYGLVNEPVVAADSGTESLALWQSVAQTITDGIRTVDKNHMIFVERMCAAQQTDGTAEQWINFNDENNYVHIKDENVVYEFHDYDPHAYTHQGFDWAGTAGNDVTYPDENYIVTTGNAVWKSSTFAGDSADIAAEGWQYLESNFMTPTADGTELICFVFQAENVGAGGVAYADELRLEEFDETGAYVQTIYANDFDTTSTLGYWSANDSGRALYTASVGHAENGCLMIAGSTDDASCSTGYFRPTAGHSYRASGYFQVLGTGDSAIVRPRVDLWGVDSIEVLNRTYLEHSVTMNIAFSETYDVPVYCGEFGAGMHCFEKGRGGDRWMSDILEIFSRADISFNYHAYNDGSFGLYTSGGVPKPENRNETLYALFCENLKE